MKAWFIISVISCCFWGGCRLIAETQAEREYLGYINRAGSANSVEMAKSELKRAVTEIEKQGLTSGYTSAAWTTPDEDLSFWYQNLTKSLKNLEDLPANSSSMEESNVLLKLKESLDGGYPSGISIYPHNVAYSWWGWLSFILAFIFYLFLDKNEY